MTIASVLVVRTIRAEDDDGEDDDREERQVQSAPAPTNTSTTVTPQEPASQRIVISNVNTNISAVIDDNENGIVDSYEAIIR